jgi:hypothetical protein
MGTYIDKKVDNFNRTESESYLQSIIAAELLPTGKLISTWAQVDPNELI